MDWLEAHTDYTGVSEPTDSSSRYPRAIPDAVRRTMLIDAAEELFLTQGFVATTMSDVARAAGMSKKTIYQVFASKSDLFMALLRTRLVAPPPTPNLESLAPKAALTLLLQQVVQHALTPDSLALRRLVIANVTQLPEVRVIFEDYCRRAHAGLLAWLQAGAARGLLRIDDVPETAMMLIGCAIGDFQCRQLAGTGASPTEAALAARVNAAVTIFMRTYGAEPAGTA